MAKMNRQWDAPVNRGDLISHDAHNELIRRVKDSEGGRNRNSFTGPFGSSTRRLFQDAAIAGGDGVEMLLKSWTDEYLAGAMIGAGDVVGEELILIARPRDMRRFWYTHTSDPRGITWAYVDKNHRTGTIADIVEEQVVSDPYAVDFSIIPCMYCPRGIVLNPQELEEDDEAVPLIGYWLEVGQRSWAEVNEESPL